LEELKPEALIAGAQIVNRLPNAREISEQTEGSFETRMVGLGLVVAEGRSREIVNVDEISAGAFGRR
jgi:hypothetical protein